MSVDLYTKSQCSYCTFAKTILQEKGVPYKEHKLGEDFTREFILERFPQQKTFPVIVIDGMNIGGYENLNTYFTITEGDIPDNRKFLVEG